MFRLIILIAIFFVGCSNEDNEKNEAPRIVSENPSIVKSKLIGKWALDLCYQGDTNDTWLKNYQTFDDIYYEQEVVVYSDSNCTEQIEGHVSFKVPYTLGEEFITDDGLIAIQLEVSGEDISSEHDGGTVSFRSIRSLQDKCLYFGQDTDDLSIYPTKLRYDACYKLVQI